MIFQQPNVFGCLEAAPELAAAAADAGALAVAHVDLASLGLLEAPGNYGCAMAIGEGQAIGNYQSYGGPHYGFLAARKEFIRRMPGRIVGETTDLDGRARLRPHAADARAAHPPREGDLEHDDEPDAPRARRARHALLARAGGLREVGETCTALAAYAKERIGAAGRVRRGRHSRRSRSARRSPRARSSRRAASTASIPASRSGATTRARRRPARRGHREAHARRRRPAGRGARGGDGLSGA